MLCGCKGVRYCKLCESSERVKKLNFFNSDTTTYSHFCLECRTNLACEHFPGNTGIALSGVSVYREFVSPSEEKSLISEMNERAWVLSQSGRRKQDYGPRANYKKQKLNLAGFNGLPRYSFYLRERLKVVPELSDFRIVEQCNLEYQEEWGSCIDGHVDDTWLWGPRITILNLLSDTVLTFTRGECEVAVPLPRRSLVVMAGDARYTWKHAIRRGDVNQHRVSLTFRELSDLFLKLDRSEDGKKILDIAKRFNDT